MPIHIKAEKEQLSPLVIAPGDPDRSKYIAENYLEDVTCYSEYRQLFGYTGKYKGVPVSVQTTGMGVPSCMIVCEELVMLGATHIIRIGTCGGLQPFLNLGSSIIATSAWGSKSTIARIVENEDYCPTSDFTTLLELYAQVKDKENTHLGPITTEALFYQDLETYLHPLGKLGCLAVEMEAAGLFALGAKHNIKTACILTVSDLVYSGAMERASEEKILEGVEMNTQVVLDALYSIKQKNK